MMKICISMQCYIWPTMYMYIYIYISDITCIHTHTPMLLFFFCFFFHLFTGIEQDQLIQQDVGPNDPGRFTISCPFTSHGIIWSLLTMNYTELTLDHHNPNFTLNLTSYDKSVKAMCFGGGHYSIQYVYPISKQVMCCYVLNFN